MYFATNIKYLLYNVSPILTNHHDNTICPFYGKIASVISLSKNGLYNKLTS